MLQGAPDLSGKRLIGLSNMWHERAAHIVSQLAGGESFAKANDSSRHIYDTCHWGEVVSRLARGRGLVHGVAARLA